MKSIRRGKSIECVLTVLTEGEAVELDRSDLHLYMVRPRGARVELPIRETEGNKVLFTVLPGVQQDYGVHNLELWKGDGGRWQTVVDVRGAFKLVPFTQDEGGEEDDADFEASTLRLTARFTGGFAVVDNLESTRADAALSANMGRVLGIRMDAAEEAAGAAVTSAETAAGDAANAASAAANAASDAAAAAAAVNGKQDALTEGTHISLAGDVVSCTLENVSELANDAGYLTEVEAISVEEVDALF